MAQYEPAFNFMMANEDSNRSGRVTPDASEAHPEAVARFGINSGAHPEAIEAGFYTMPLVDAIEWAAVFYRKAYWEPLLGPEIAAQDVANKIFDLGVNEGLTEVTKIVQRATNFVTTPPSLIVDGRPGPATLAALNAADPVHLLQSIKNYAIDFYKGWAFRTNQPERTLQALLARVNK